MAAIGLNGVKVGTTSSQAYLEGKAVKETRALMAELCRHFYTLGWVTGTGGSISMKVHDDSIPRPQQLILMAPSGIFPFPTLLVAVSQVWIFWCLLVISGLFGFWVCARFFFPLCCWILFSQFKHYGFY